MEEIPRTRGRSPEGRPAGRAESAESRTLVMTGDDVHRAVVRMAHEIIERNRVLDDLHIVGIQRGGVWIAHMLVAAMRDIEPTASVGAGSLDVSLFRDDISLRPVSAVSTSDIASDLTGTTVVLVDDVLFTGRTVRAALDAITQFGRPERVQLAVVVDRGHRELPIRPDYIGKNLPTSRTAEVLVEPTGVSIVEADVR